MEQLNNRMEYLNRGLELVAKQMIDVSSGVEFSVIRAVAMARPMAVPSSATAVACNHLERASGPMDVLGRAMEQACSAVDSTSNALVAVAPVLTGPRRRLKSSRAALHDRSNRMAGPSIRMAGPSIRMDSTGDSAIALSSPMESPIGPMKSLSVPVDGQ